MAMNGQPMSGALSRRRFLEVGFGAGVLALGLPGCSTGAASPGPSGSGGGGSAGAGQTPVTLKIVGFQVSPDEKGSDLDKSYQKFLADFHAKYPWITIDSLETPPDFDTQLVVDLSSGTAPDIWSQDASSLAALSDRHLLLDMRKCSDKVPELNWDRFFPSVLAINKAPDGSIWGVPNDFTPMVTYYNPKLFKAAGLSEPKAGWTWDDQLAAAKALTVDAAGKHPDDAGFDVSSVKVWGMRAYKYTYTWVFKVWQNGGDVLSPDFKTASGYLDSAATIEALQWYVDLVRKHHVAPAPSTLDSITQKSSFTAEYVAGRFGMFDSGHWSLVGFLGAKGFDPASLRVVPQAKRKQEATVLYESSFAVRHDLPDDKLEAVARFVNEASGPMWQDTKAQTGIAIAANQSVAQSSLTSATTKFKDLDKVFIDATSSGRPPYGSKLAKYPTIESRLDKMMEAMMDSGDIQGEVAKAVKDINTELGA